MLNSLKIENIAIIESAEIEFGRGLNVLTGETGAGKSIIIDALNAALGERTSHDIIRTGAQSARVTAVFEDVGSSVNAMLDELGIGKSEDNTVVITRVITSDARNTCRINAAPANVSMLKLLGSALINIHGQHDNQALLSPDKHYLYIDSLASNSAILQEYKQTYYALISVKKELDALCRDENEKSARLDYLNFQIDELEKAGIVPGEREELSRQKLLYSNSQKVIEALNKAYTALSGTDDENGALSLLTSCADSLMTAQEYYPDIAAGAQSVREASYSLEDCAAAIRSSLDGFDYNPQRLAEINERLDFLYRLCVKYGTGEGDMLDYLEKLKDERSGIMHSDQKVRELEDKLSAFTDALVRKSDRLTESRRKAARLFEQRVRSELDFLDMPGVVFKVEIAKSAYSSRGADAVEFLISANAGQEPRPLSKIASGGELSRIMLAIKSVISAKDDIGTLIFDEIDTGVSGRAAQKIAMKLYDVSLGRQVICVTHLAQIAAQAGRHILISKCVDTGKTYTSVEALGLEGRVRELARITGGLEVTAIQLQGAREMLEEANAYQEKRVTTKL